MNKRPAERIARNEAIFRTANEQIAGSAADFGIDDFVPLICECADRDCSDVVLLSTAQYESVRANPRHFFSVPGHQSAAAGVGRVVERHAHFVVYEKPGR